MLGCAVAINACQKQQQVDPLRVHQDGTDGQQHPRGCTCQLVHPVAKPETKHRMREILAGQFYKIGVKK